MNPKQVIAFGERETVATDEGLLLKWYQWGGAPLSCMGEKAALDPFSMKQWNAIKPKGPEYDVSLRVICPPARQHARWHELIAKENAGLFCGWEMEEGVAYLLLGKRVARAFAQANEVRVPVPGEELILRGRYSMLCLPDMGDAMYWSLRSPSHYRDMVLNFVKGVNDGVRARRERKRRTEPEQAKYSDGVRNSGPEVLTLINGKIVFQARDPLRAM